ncbi:hypothetical protein B9Z55_012529 [Caenorhabditis nigoni]|nr:hypothetical protein B9Z55_012529 [Caenorhabditis nigoni]
MWLFYQKRKAVLDAYLAGVIPFENLPCQIKILEAEYGKCPHWTSFIQVKELSRMTGVHQNVIYKYFKMRQKMDEKMKVAMSEDISKDPSEIVKPSKLDVRVVLVPDQDDQASSISPGVGTQQESKDPDLTMPATQRKATQPLPLKPHRDTEYEMEDSASSASSTADVRLVAHKDPHFLLSATETAESSSLPHGPEDQHELDDPIAPGPAMEVVYRQQTHGSQYPEELIEEEYSEMQEDEYTIPSHGALPDWDLMYAHMWRNSVDQAQLSLQTMSPRLGAPSDCPGPSSNTLLPSIWSRKVDYPTSTMVPSPKNSVQLQNHQAGRSQLLADIYRAAQEAQQSYLASVSRTPTSKKRKRSPSQDILTDEPSREAVFNASPQVMDQRPSVSSDRVEVKRERWDSPEDLDNMCFASTSYITRPTSIPRTQIVNQGTGNSSEAHRTHHKSLATPSASSSPVMRQCFSYPETPTGVVVGDGIEQVLPTLPQPAESTRPVLQTPENQPPEQQVDGPTPTQTVREQPAKALADCPRPAPKELLPLILSGEMDFPTSPMTPASLNSVPAHNYQTGSSQQDVKPQKRLVLSRDEVKKSHSHIKPTQRNQDSNKRKRSSSSEVFTNKPSVSSTPDSEMVNRQEIDNIEGIEVQMLPEALIGVNEIVAPTPERMVQLRQERTKLHGWWFEKTHLPFNHSINYKSWTTQQFEEFAIQFLPSDVVTALVKEKVDGSKIEKIRCKNKKLMGRLHIGSNGIFALGHWNLIRKNIEEIRAYKIYKKKEEEFSNTK